MSFSLQMQDRLLKKYRARDSMEISFKKIIDEIEMECYCTFDMEQVTFNDGHFRPISKSICVVHQYKIQRPRFC